MTGPGMRSLFRRHRAASAVLILSLALALFFAIRLGLGALYWSQHAQEPVQPWMTAGYVGRSWNLDPRAIDRVAGLPPPQGRPLTLDEIARQRGVPVADIIARVERAVAELQATRPQGAAGTAP